MHASDRVIVRPRREGKEEEEEEAKDGRQLKSENGARDRHVLMTRHTWQLLSPDHKSMQQSDQMKEETPHIS